MNKSSTINHPKTCFGISRHNVIIPLKLVDITDFKDGCFKYTFAINHPKPTDYMETHLNADFHEFFITEDRPLCDEYTKVRLTLEDAKKLVTKELNAERNATIRKLNSIDKDLSKIDNDVKELELAIQTCEA